MRIFIDKPRTSAELNLQIFRRVLFTGVCMLVMAVVNALEYSPFHATPFVMCAIGMFFVAYVAKNAAPEKESP